MRFKSQLKTIRISNVSEICHFDIYPIFPSAHLRADFQACFTNSTFTIILITITIRRLRETLLALSRSLGDFAEVLDTPNVPQLLSSYRCRDDGEDADEYHDSCDFLSP